MRSLVALGLCLTMTTVPVGAQQPAAGVAAGDSMAPIPLWPAGAPGALGTTPLDSPTVTPYLAPRAIANGTAAVIFPGGGYEHLATEKEGVAIARWLNGLGISGFVVRYRLGPRYHHPVMLEDAQRAVRLVRTRAAAFAIDPRRVGVVGFSAGGHLASTVGTHFDAGYPASADSVERASSRPDFMILIYPVITMRAPFAHEGSRRALLGDHPSPALVDSLSNETRVTDQTPPTFLVATSDDATVPVENTLLFYGALHAAHVPAEMHIYESGPHGFGLAAADPALSSWTALCATWLERHGWPPRPVRGKEPVRPFSQPVLRSRGFAGSMRSLHPLFTETRSCVRRRCGPLPGRGGPGHPPGVRAEGSSFLHRAARPAGAGRGQHPRRPWHPYAKTDISSSAVYIDCWMDDHIGAKGWDRMSSVDSTGTRVWNEPENACFFEYGTTGTGAISSPRRRLLTAEDAKAYTPVRVLDGWVPALSVGPGL